MSLTQNLGKAVWQHVYPLFQLCFMKVYTSTAGALEAAIPLLLCCPHPSLPVVASTSHPRLSRCKVRAGPSGALGRGAAGDAVAPLVALVGAEKARTSGSR